MAIRYPFALYSYFPPRVKPGFASSGLKYSSTVHSYLSAQAEFGVGATSILLR